VKALDDVRRLQCMNDLMASGSYLCLLRNFGRPRLGINRVVHRFAGNRNADLRRFGPNTLIACA